MRQKKKQGRQGCATCFFLGGSSGQDKFVLFRFYSGGRGSLAGAKKIRPRDHCGAGPNGPLSVRYCSSPGWRFPPALSASQDRPRDMFPRCADGRASVTANQMPQGRQSTHLSFSRYPDQETAYAWEAGYGFYDVLIIPPFQVRCRRCQGFDGGFDLGWPSEGRSQGTRVEDRFDVSESRSVEMRLFPRGPRGPWLSAATKYQDMSQRSS